MGYFLYRIEFTTAVHIGSHIGGASLDNAQMSIHSDTLFAALCCEAVKRGKIDELVNYFAQGQLCISDALPYYKEELFLPKPVLYAGKQENDGNPGLKKKFKSLAYIPLSLFEKYLNGLSNAGSFNPDTVKSEFGQMTVQTRVAITGQPLPLPYHVASWNFAPNCGLYIILRSEMTAATELFETLLQNLAWEGLGGKQSSGWGKFKVMPAAIPPQMEKYLEDRQAPYQMLMGTALPVDTEMDKVLQGGWFTLLRRGGFVRSENYADRPLKKRTIYMLASGSCFHYRFQGGMFDLSQQGNHPVWRTGNTLFVGVNI